jgi:Ssp1 endopeptidase immunity protein Rap1a
MRSLFSLVLLLFALNAQAQEHFIDGGVLYERLQRKDPSSIAYIFGIYDAIQIVQYHGAVADQYFCAPTGVTGLQLADGVRDFLESDPAMSEYPAGILVLRALISMFPCGKT